MINKEGILPNSRHDMSIPPKNTIFNWDCPRNRLLLCSI